MTSETCRVANSGRCDRVPTHGTVFSSTNQWRDYLVSADGSYPYTDSVVSFDGNYTTAAGLTAQTVKGKEYRLLLR